MSQERNGHMEVLAMLTRWGAADPITETGKEAIKWILMELARVEQQKYLLEYQATLTQRTLKQADAEIQRALEDARKV